MYDKTLALSLEGSDFLLHSAGDPKPDSQDPHVLGPPGSASIRQTAELRIRILPFSHIGVERTEIMLAK
jgi:hypothetical protein